PFYPSESEVTAIDLAPGMLARARRRAERLGANVDLRLEDAQALSFSDNAFDTAVGTFVFCSVPDAVLGLRELARVVRPGGQVLLLEHVRSPREAVGKVMDLLDPPVSYLLGVHINRRTVDNVRKAGLDITDVEELAFGGIFKLIEARVPAGSS
ncbi:MAG: methyltransferase domain-containing protein, partial [Gemmatimonadetes bacterium]|nr:methyltransferase domain-containing protein [Gemmatimonadota bacterium]